MSIGTVRDPKDASRRHFIDNLWGLCPVAYATPWDFFNQRRVRWVRLASIQVFWAKKGGAWEMHRPFDSLRTL